MCRQNHDKGKTLNKLVTKVSYSKRKIERKNKRTKTFSTSSVLNNKDKQSI